MSDHQKHDYFSTFTAKLDHPPRRLWKRDLRKNYIVGFLLGEGTSTLPSAGGTISRFPLQFTFTFALMPCFAAEHVVDITAKPTKRSAFHLLFVCFCFFCGFKSFCGFWYESSYVRFISTAYELCRILLLTVDQS